MDNPTIREIALANGFKLKVQDDGSTDLNPYVYDFARALLAQQTAENDALWETLIKIGDALDIDYEEARKADGKPSDVFIAHIKSMEATINGLEEQVENLGQSILDEKTND